jgi:hypothetical protein
MAYKGEVKERLEGLPTTGTGEVRLRDAQRTGTVTIREYWDESLGKELALLSKAGSPRVSKINGNKRYDLSDVEQRLEYFHIKNHPIYSKGGNAIFECVNLDEVAEENVRDRELFDYQKS